MRAPLSQYTRIVDEQGRPTKEFIDLWQEFANIYPGTWTPTLTNVTNISASSAYLCQYFRVGKMVLCFGRVDADPVASATNTQLDMSLPIPSNFGATQDCAGVAAGAIAAGEVGPIAASVANDRAQLVWITSSTANHSMYFIFAYEIN